MCTNTGDTCQFDELTKFNKSAKPVSTKFRNVLGLLLQNPAKVRTHTLQSRV